MTTPTEVIAELISRSLALAEDGYDPHSEDVVSDCITVLDAAGWAIVPKVPTPEMIEAGRAEIKPDGLPADDSDACAMWAAMLAAAPKP